MWAKVLESSRDFDCIVFELRLFPGLDWTLFSTIFTVFLEVFSVFSVLGGFGWLFSGQFRVSVFGSIRGRLFRGLCSFRASRLVLLRVCRPRQAWPALSRFVSVLLCCFREIRSSIYWLRPGRPNLRFCCCGFSRFWFSCFVVLSGLISILISVCFRVLSGGLGLVLNALEYCGPGYSCFWCSLALFGPIASETFFFTRFWGTLETPLLDEALYLNVKCLFCEKHVFSRFWACWASKTLFIDQGSETSYFNRFGASRKKCKSKEGIGSGSAACCLSKKHTFSRRISPFLAYMWAKWLKSSREFDFFVFELRLFPGLDWTLFLSMFTIILEVLCLCSSLAISGDCFRLIWSDGFGVVFSGLFRMSLVR